MKNLITAFNKYEKSIDDEVLFSEVLTEMDKLDWSLMKKAKFLTLYVG